MPYWVYPEILSVERPATTSDATPRCDAPRNPPAVTPVAAPHHRDPRYVVMSARVRAAANTNPNTRCWRCQRTLDAHPNTRTGRPPRWQAGHTIDGTWITTDPWGGLRPEVDVCNTSAGAAAGNRRREPHTGGW